MPLAKRRLWTAFQRLGYVFICRTYRTNLPYVELFITPSPVGGRGIVFERFLCLFISLSPTWLENGWTDLHEIFREGVEWPWDDLIKFWVNSRKQVGGSKVNLLSPALVSLWSSGCPVLPPSDWELMKLLFLAFRYVAAGGGVCWAPHHSL